MKKTLMRFFNPSLIFAVGLLLKLMITDKLLFGEMDLIGILLTDFSMFFACYILLSFLFKRKVWISYFITNIVSSSLLVAVLMYKDYFNSILTYHAFAQASQLASVSASIEELYQNIYLVYFLDIVLVALLLTVYRSKLNFVKRSIKSHLVFLSGFAIILSVYYSTTDINGMVSERAKAEESGLIAFQFYSNYSDVHVAIEDVTMEKIRGIKGIQKKEDPYLHGVAEDKNVIVVQLEAFQDFVVDLNVDGQAITPTLNKLKSDSFYFPNFYQQVGRGNTSDSEFMLNTSIYPVGYNAMSQEYEDKAIPSLPKLLKAKNYETVTFHTNEMHYWNRDKMYQALGFDNAYDKEFFGEKDYIAFGASDEVLYDKSIKVLQDIVDSGKNIYANYIAMSSHHPYKVLEKMRELNLPDSVNKGTVGDYLQAAHYVDSALGGFINELKEIGIWEDTVLVVYGDHFGLKSLEFDEQQALKELIGEPYTQKEAFNIPLFIHVPGVEGKVMENVGGQVDTMPTIANLVGLSLENQIHFGQDLLNNEQNLLAERFYMPTGSFINEDVIYTSGKDYFSGEALSLETGERVALNNTYGKQFERVMKLLQYSDAYVNSLPRRD